METFEAVLKNNRPGYLSTGSWIITFINLLVFLVLFFQHKTSLAPFICSAIALVVSFWLRTRLFLAKFKFSDLLYLVLALSWVYIPVYILSAVCILLLITSRLAAVKVCYIFSAEGILKKGFPEKKSEWNTVSFIVLKDNMLTIEFKNNHNLQQEIEESGINQELFNKFVMASIKNASK